MNTAIQYINIDEKFHHPECAVLFREHDEITTLADCPFPIKTDTYEVVLFGRNRIEKDATFAVVRYQKKCGHVVEERIPFMEHVEDFEHHGTKFKGADYSAKNYAARIEFFRTSLGCDVCKIVEHSRWIFGIGHGVNSRARAIARCLMLLDANFGNWRNFITEKEIVAKFNATKRGGE